MTEDCWKAFDAAIAADADASILAQFAADPERLERFSLTAAGLFVDLSKQSWTRAGFKACLTLARACDVESRRDALFAGEPVNMSEGRAVLHPALRAPDGAAFRVADEAVSPKVEATRAQMKALAGDIRAGRRKGATGRPFTTIVHIGIGGSDLGPRLLWEAMRSLDGPIGLRFLSSLDEAEFAAAVHGLDPETTLVIVASKSFGTVETTHNLIRIQSWLRNGLPGRKSSSHIIAVTAAGDRARRLACGEVVPFEDWVGGRFSLWSPVGLSCAIALGWDVFEQLLAGAAKMDDHFRSAPLERNAPVLMALAEIWNVNGLGRQARAVIPYLYRLGRLPAWLQQLEMESNGKSVGPDGAPAGRAICPVVFGEPGTNAQHAFFQMLHQGALATPVDFIVAGRAGGAINTALLTHAVAQAEALMIGKTETAVRGELAGSDLAAAAIDRLAPQKAFPGNRPSTFIDMGDVAPGPLGALLAMYEHKTFVEGVIWGINSFDQWGVELGKSLAKAIEDEADQSDPPAHDPSTEALISRLRLRS